MIMLMPSAERNVIHLPDKANLVIYGGRDFDGYDRMCDIIENSELYKNGLIGNIVCGMAAGADLLGKRFAEEHGISVIEMPADWKRYGRSAGHRRNQEMADISQVGLGFWDGESKGTAGMNGILDRMGIPHRVERYHKYPNLKLCHVSELKDMDVQIKACITRKDVHAADVQWVPDLAPSPSLYGFYIDHKNDPDVIAEYTRRWFIEKRHDVNYQTKINNVRFHLRQGRSVALACFCVDESKCHRRLVKQDIERM